MLTLKLLQENKTEVIERLRIKNFDATALVDRIIELDNKRKATQTESDNLQAEMNRLSKSIGQLMKNKELAEAEAAKARTAGLKDEIKELTTTLDSIEKELQQLLVQLPNLPHQSVPAGKGAEDNVIVQEGGRSLSLRMHCLTGNLPGSMIYRLRTRCCLQEPASLSIRARVPGCKGL